MRPSGRAPDQMRELRFEPGFTRHAEGSCLVSFGDTRVLCTASEVWTADPVQPVGVVRSLGRAAPRVARPEGATPRRRRRRPRQPRPDRRGRVAPRHRRQPALRSPQRPDHRPLGHATPVDGGRSGRRCPRDRGRGDRTRRRHRPGRLVPVPGLLQRHPRRAGLPAQSGSSPRPSGACGSGAECRGPPARPAPSRQSSPGRPGRRISGSSSLHRRLR